MRVEQQNQILEALQQAAGKDVKTASGIVAEKAKTTKSVSDRQTSIQMKDTTYLNPAREEKKSIAEKIEESSGMDAFEPQKSDGSFIKYNIGRRLCENAGGRFFPGFHRFTYDYYGDRQNQNAACKSRKRSVWR